MRTRVLILGGGVGGTVIANGLCRRLSRELNAGRVGITVLDNCSRHLYQPGLLYLPFGQTEEASMFRDERSLLDRRVEFAVDPATRIDIDKKRVVSLSGTVREYDFLVIATGSLLAPEMVPGLKEGAHSFYDLESAKRMRAAIDGFQGGRIVINVNIPYKCPVAPLECAMMLHEHLCRRGLDGKFEILYTFPIGSVHGLEPVSNWALPEFERRGIKTEFYFNAKEVDVANRTISSEEGDTLSYDLLITIPPHRGARVIEESGLGKMGWVLTHPKTLLLEGVDDAFACGDTTNIPSSKSGSVAHFEASIIVENLSRRIKGEDPVREYGGTALCILETGKSTATYVLFDYEKAPHMRPPNHMVHWGKKAFGRLYWLSLNGMF